MAPSLVQLFVAVILLWQALSLFAPTTLGIDGVLAVQSSAAAWTSSPESDATTLFALTEARISAFMVLGSWFGDPGFCLHFILPYLWGVSGRGAPVVPLAVLFAFLTADATNAWLKWPLEGGRPYWMDARVRQFPMTCEVGFGDPSGHVMVTTTVWLLLCRRGAGAGSGSGSEARRQWLWLVPLLLLPWVAISRVYVEEGREQSEREKRGETAERCVCSEERREKNRRRRSTVPVRTYVCAVKKEEKRYAVPICEYRSGKREEQR